MHTVNAFLTELAFLLKKNNKNVRVLALSVNNLYRFYTSTDLRYVHMCFTFPKSILFKVQVSDRFGLLTYLYVQKQEREYIDGNYRTEKIDFRGEVRPQA